MRTWDGIEYLLMSGCDMTRFLKNPVLLDCHNRWNVGDIIGGVEARIDDKQLIALCTYATTPRAEDAWTLTREGFARALSIGYSRRKAVQLREGESYGDTGITGPAIVVTEWELYEVSQVPVPADQDAVRRHLLSEDASEASRAVTALIRGLERLVEPRGEEEMADTPEAPANAPETPEEVRSFAPVAAEIRALAPEGMRAFADELILQDGMTVEKARAAFLERLRAQAKPAGTPEPVAPAPETPKQPSIADVDDSTLARSLGF